MGLDRWLHINSRTHPLAHVAEAGVEAAPCRAACYSSIQLLGITARQLVQRCCALPVSLEQSRKRPKLTCICEGGEQTEGPVLPCSSSRTSITCARCKKHGTFDEGSFIEVKGSKFSFVMNLAQEMGDGREDLSVWVRFAEYGWGLRRA